MKMNLDDQKLTAFALGELPETERAAMEDAVASSPEAQAYIAETQQLAGLLKDEYAGEQSESAEALAERSPNIVRMEEQRRLWSNQWGSLAAALTIFAVVAVPIVVRQLSYTVGPLSLWRDVRSDREFRSLNAVLVAAALFLMVCRIVSFVGTERTAEAEKFPRAAVHFIRDNRPDGPIFNLYEWGGYLIWNLHPQWKVYVDGRPEIYGDAYIQEYIDAYYGRRSWQKLLQRTDIQTVLVEPIAPLASLLRESPDWQNAFEDQVAVVFIHRDATGSALNRSK